MRENHSDASLHSVRLPCPAVQGPAHFLGSLAVLLHITKPAENAMDEAGKQAIENKNIVVFRLSLPAQRGPPVSSPACGLPFKAAPCQANLFNRLNMPSSLVLFPPACLQTCFDASARLIRPGKKASEVSAVLNKIAEAYGCT